MKMHELLSIEASVQTAYKDMLNETESVFDRPDLFQEWIRHYDPIKEEDEHERGEVERHAITTTVDERLDFLRSFFVDSTDLILQKERTNQMASGELEIEGYTFPHLPVGFLLFLERRLQELKSVVMQIPTTPSSVEWKQDTSRGDSVMKAAHPEVTNRTRKRIVPVVLAEATPQHPAQVKESTEEQVIGKYTKEVWVGMWTPAQKSDTIVRIEEVYNAVRQARMRANEEQVDSAAQIAGSLWQYIFAE